MSRRAWSAFILPAFPALALPALAACGQEAAKPAEPPRPPPPAVSSSVAVTPPPPPAKAPRSPKLGPLVVAAPVVGEQGSPRAEVAFAHTRGFAVALADFGAPMGGPCPIAALGCSLFSVAKRPATASFDPVPRDLETMGAALPVPRRWLGLSAGRDAIFGFRDDRKNTTVDRIDAAGTVTPFLRVEGMQAASARILETKTKTFLLVEPEVEKRTLQAFEVETKDGQTTLASQSLTLPYATAMPRFPGGAVGAMRAREATWEDEGISALWGPYRAFPLLDDTGAETDDWAVALVAVHPPPPEWPEGKVFHKKKSKAKNDCGGKSSRALSDKSVEKVVRVLRIRGGKLASDQAIQTSNTYDHDKSPLVALPRPGGRIEVDGVLFGPDGKREKGGKKPERVFAPLVPGVPLAVTPLGGEAGAITFDAASGEGAYAFYDGGPGRKLVRFDAGGKPKGAVEGADAVGELARLRGEWASVGPLRATWLTGPEKGKTVEQKLGQSASLSVSDGERVVYFRLDGKEKVATYAFDAKTNEWVAGKTVAEEGIKATARKAVLVDGQAALVEVGPKAARLVKADGTILPLGDLGGLKPILLRSVFGDVVAVTQSPTETIAHWLLAKGRAAIPREVEVTPLGFGWPDGEALFDAEPGPIVTHPDLPDLAAAGCTVATPTGPRSWVFGCASAVDPVKPGRAIGLRSFSY